MQATARAVSPNRGDAGFVPLLLLVGRRRIVSIASTASLALCCPTAANDDSHGVALMMTASDASLHDANSRKKFDDASEMTH